MDFKEQLEVLQRIWDSDGLEDVNRTVAASGEEILPNVKIELGIFEGVSVWESWQVSEGNPSGQSHGTLKVAILVGIKPFDSSISQNTNIAQNSLDNGCPPSARHRAVAPSMESSVLRQLQQPSSTTRPCPSPIPRSQTSGTYLRFPCRSQQFKRL